MRLLPLLGSDDKKIISLNKLQRTSLREIKVALRIFFTRFSTQQVDGKLFVMLQIFIAAAQTAKHQEMSNKSEMTTCENDNPTASTTSEV